MSKSSGQCPIWRKASIPVMAVLMSSLLDAPLGAAGLVYPAAPRDPVVEDHFGTKVADPYRWLEDLDSARTRTWVEAQGRLADAYLAALPARPALRERLARLQDFEKFGVPRRRGARVFFTRNSGLQEQSVFYMAERVDDPDPVVALDPNALQSEGHLAVVGYVVRDDGRLLAYGVSESGSDWTQWRLRDLVSGRDLPDRLEHSKYYPPVFSADGLGLYYGAFPAPARGEELAARDLGHSIRYHEIGTPATQDREVFSLPGHPDWQYWPGVSSDGRWLVVLVGAGEVGDTGLEDVYLLDLQQAGAKPLALATGFGAGFEYVGDGAGRLFFFTSLAAPRGRVVAMDARKPAAGAWQEVIPQGDDAIALGGPGHGANVTLVGHRFFVQSLHDAHARVSTWSFDGRRLADVALPGAGTVGGFEGGADDQETYFAYTDLVTPTTILRHDLATGRNSVVHAPRAAFDPSGFEQRQVFYPSKDGTRIPLLIAYRKGLVLDGSAPLLLYGYGGFGIPMLPAFRASRIAWLERGGIYAIANIRGGGEYGEDWHRQAIREHKQVVFDDFIAAAEWLVANHYTARERLAIQGGSNGGLLVGACITQRPELYGAAVAAVGVLDMLRFDRFGQGSGWTGDYGSPSDAGDFRALLAYSPVHNVRAGTKYPATLVITGDHDTRVYPMHSFKFAAALQAAQASTAPVLLRLESRSGHGGGTTVSQAVEQDADIYAFLLHELHAGPPGERNAAPAAAR